MQNRLEKLEKVRPPQRRDRQRHPIQEKLHVPQMRKKDKTGQPGQGIEIYQQLPQHHIPALQMLNLPALHMLSHINARFLPAFPTSLNGLHCKKKKVAGKPWALLFRPRSARLHATPSTYNFPSSIFG